MAKKQSSSKKSLGVFHNATTIGGIKVNYKYSPLITVEQHSELVKQIAELADSDGNVKLQAVIHLKVTDPKSTKATEEVGTLELVE